VAFALFDLQTTILIRSNTCKWIEHVSVSI